MTVTSQSTKWEIINSLWILLTLPLGSMSWVAFLYIGIQTQQKKWVLSGVVYLVVFIISLIVAVSELRNSLSLFIGYFISIVWIVSLIQAFWVRKEYLLRLEAIQEEKAYLIRKHGAELKRKYAQEYSDRKINPFSKNHSQKESNVDETEKRTQKTVPESKLDITTPVVDINHDSEKLIATLPGINSEMAKKAIETRQSQPFISLNKFGEALGLNPETILKIEPLIYIDESLKPKEPPESSQSGRQVDY